MATVRVQRSAQIFELDADTTINAPDAAPIDIAPAPSLLQTASPGASSVRLAGVVSSVKPGDVLLLLERGWTGTDNNWALVVVRSVTQQKDAHGNANTRIAFPTPSAPALPADAAVAGYRLLRAINTQGHCSSRIRT